MVCINTTKSSGLICSNYDFFENSIASNQAIDFSGVDAHYQNRIAERMIKTITYYDQIMLLNTMIFWTYVITTEFLPYAIKLAIHVGNNCPDYSGLTALDNFSSTKGHTRVKNFILLDGHASSLTPNFFKTNIFQNGYLDQSKPFILVYPRSTQEVSLRF